jgi:hypothetical protein
MPESDTYVCFCTFAPLQSRCLEDLQSTTRYVTWGLHTGQNRGFKAMLSKVGAQHRCWPYAALSACSSSDAVLAAVAAGIPAPDLA